MLLKSIIYRPYSEFVTFLIAWIITGQIRVSLVIGFANLFTKVFSYFIFDLFWNKFVRLIGYETNEHTPPDHIKNISATKIRESIKNGDNYWKEFVNPIIHEDVENYLK